VAESVDEPDGALPAATGDLLGRAESAYRAAVANPATAEASAAAIVAEARLQGSIEPLVVGLRAQAWAARALLDGARAVRLLNEAARLAERADLAVRLGEVLMVRAAAHQELGRARSAQRDLQRARTLLGRKAPPELELQCAVLHQNAGRLADAAAIYRQILHQDESPVDIRAKVSNNLGLIEAHYGHYGVAMALLGQARTLALEVGPALTAYFAEGEAWVMAHAGRLPESLTLFDEAERLFSEAGLPLGELYAEYADAMLDLRLIPEARRAADQALREFTVTNVPLMQGEAQLRVARVALLADDLSVADDAAGRAVVSFRRQQRTGWAARAVVVRTEARLQWGSVTREDLQHVRRAATTLERLAHTAEAVEGHLTAGRAAVALDRTAWATASFDRAHALARGSSMLTRLRGRMAAAASATIRDDRSRALRHCREGLADLQRHRRLLGSTELRVLASAHGVELGQIALRAMTQSSSEVDVFNWLERNRSAALMSVQRTTVEGFAEEFDRLRSMQAQIQDSGGASPALVARSSALEQRLRRLTWDAATTTDPASRTTSTGELRPLLGDRLLVEYGVLDGEVFAVVVSGRHVSLTRLAPLKQVRDHVGRLSFSLRRLLSPAPSEANATRMRQARSRLEQLRALLVDPLALPPESELVIVPIDILQSVPWSALHEAPVSLSPSATFWASTCRNVRSDLTKVLLAAGPRLPAAEEEVRKLSAVHADHVVLSPPDSTVSKVANALEDTGTAHFACHGVVRSDNPMFSGLLLSDGYLTVQELELRNLAPYRVVLAACEAAADSSYAGGETLGFVSALIARGTAGVLGSILLVPDHATAPFMLRVHERLHGGETLAGALHAARATLDVDDPADLVNWCGFTAYGAA